MAIATHAAVSNSYACCRQSLWQVGSL